MIKEFLFGFLQEMIHFNIENTIIFSIAIMLIMAATFAFIARLLKQPLIPSYVIAGFLLGPVVLGFIKDTELIYAFSEIGIAFLLFAAGLEISFKKIKEVNLKKILIIGFIQVVSIFGITLFLGDYLNLTTIQAVYIGIILSFSSTMVVTKLLSDKGELVTLHGRLVLGILLLQDLFAVLFIGILMAKGFSFLSIIIVFLKILIMIALAVFLNILFLNKIFKFAARSIELLFLSSLAILFLFVILAIISNLSVVIGAFIAGMSLANSPFKIELESRMSPLRDFFAILFFIALGMQLVFKGILEQLNLFLYLIIGMLILKPAIILFLLRIFGYKTKTASLAAISLAQLSEFSLIIGFFGVKNGVLTQPIFSSIIFSTIISMASTTYFIEYKNQIYWFFQKPFRRIPFLEKEKDDKKSKSVLLVGVHRMGSIILKNLTKNKKELLVIDHNPEIISHLKDKKIDCIYGDIGSPDIFEKINIKNMKTVISTVPDYEENLRLLKKTKEKNNRAVVILTATRISEALLLYENGADYVILPKVVAGKEISEVLKNKGELKEMKRRHIKLLNDIHNILY